MLLFWCLLCFSSYEHYLIDCSELFLSFLCILACTSTILVFISISLLSHTWNYFSRMVVDSTTRLTHMHVVSFFEFSIHCLHAWPLIYAYTKHHHAFTFTFSFSFPLVSLVNLGPHSTSPNNIMQSWEGGLCLPLQKYTFLPKHSPLVIFCAFLRDSDYWPNKLRNAVTEPTTIATWDCALCNSSCQKLD